MRFSQRVLCSFAALASVCTLGLTPASAYTSLYVFGDSLSDVGNVFIGSGGTLPAPPYFHGHFTNGPNWVDDLSAGLGLGPVTASLAGGNDYAFGGATTSLSVPGTTSDVPNVAQQVGLFSLQHGGAAPSGALYSMWIGSIDVLTALADISAGTLSPLEAEADLTRSAQAAAGALAALAGEGATNFLVGLVPDLALTPRLNKSAPAAATLLSAYFNTQLVDAINSSLPNGLNVTYLDTFTLLDRAVADPGAFGLTNVTDACYTGTYAGDGSVCPDPASSLFWDDIHPTEKGHQAIAALALSALSGGSVSAVPLPDSLPLYASGLVLLAVFGRRARIRG